MNNLVPEQRVDKNGRTVTRHVRATKEEAPGKTLPTPKLAKRKASGVQVKPTKQQAREHFYMFDARKHSVDPDLLTALGITPHSRTGVLASEHQTYDVLAVTDRGTAIALLEAGVKNASDAKKTLKMLGRGDLLQDNSGIATEALKRGILSFRYIEHGTKDDSGNPHFLDYLEALSIMSMSQYPDMHKSVSNGSINLADIQTVTPARITVADDWRTIKQSLTSLASGTANYTAAEIGEVLDRYTKNGPSLGPTLRQAFELADNYGAQFAIEIPPTDSTMQLSNHLLDHEVDVERSKSILRYNHRVFFNLSGFSSAGRPKYSKEDIIAFHDAGANPDHVANGSITLTQVDGIKNHGIAPSVSGGWL